MTNQDRRYDEAASAASRAMTLAYSTSFSAGIRLFGHNVRQPVYDIYGLVRLADEIVDSWQHLDQAGALAALEDETMMALDSGFSLNPIIYAYARTAIKYRFERDWTEAFFASMRADLLPDPVKTAVELEEYVYGSAEVVGLMCLAVFTEGDKTGNKGLELGARALGNAFQKINFLRDIAADQALGRTYFPEVRSHGLIEEVKSAIISDISLNLRTARGALAGLPASSRSGVALAVRYYEDLLERLDRAPVVELLERRIRVPNTRKLTLFMLQIVGRS